LIIYKILKTVLVILLLQCVYPVLMITIVLC